MPLNVLNMSKARLSYQMCEGATLYCTSHSIDLHMSIKDVLNSNDSKTWVLQNTFGTVQELFLAQEDKTQKPDLHVLLSAISLKRMV